MNRFVTICIITPAGKSVRQATVSRGFVLAVGLLMLVGLGTTGIGYRSLLGAREAAMNIERLETVVSRQHQTILRQRDEIQRFALRLSAFGEGLEKLRRLETKVRILADLDPKVSGGGNFGVGGGGAEAFFMPPASRAETAALVRQMGENAALLDAAARNRTQSLASLVSGLEEKVDVLASTPSIRPTLGWKTSGFGYRASPFTGQRELHRALDIANASGTPILATADGVVVRTAKVWPRGKHLVVDHGYGMTTVYAHLDRFLKKPGETVHRGETIALMGNTGRTTGPHLHYEVRRKGVPVNPETYILN